MTPKLKSVNIGMNRFCGPAVLSILTGKSTDECAKVISQINGQYRVEGVMVNDLLQATDRLGFDQKCILDVHIHGTRSLYRLMTQISSTDGIYIIQVVNHFVVVEVQDKHIYFCDNHTKEPIPAASSARMMQRVFFCYQVIERPKTEADLERERLEEVRRQLANIRAEFKQRMATVCYDLLNECHSIGNSIGDISLDAANEAVVKLFMEKADKLVLFMEKVKQI